MTRVAWGNRTLVKELLIISAWVIIGRFVGVGNKLLKPSTPCTWLPLIND